MIARFRIIVTDGRHGRGRRLEAEQFIGGDLESLGEDDDDGGRRNAVAVLVVRDLTLLGFGSFGELDLGQAARFAEGHLARAEAGIVFLFAWHLMGDCKRGIEAGALGYKGSGIIDAIIVHHGHQNDRGVG